MNVLSCMILSLLLAGPYVEQKDTVTAEPFPEDLKKMVERVIKKAQSNDIEMEIDGLLVDDTRTRAGKEFYDLFYTGWETPEQAKNYTITLSERPFRLTMTLIIVSINETPVYQSILQPRQNVLEEQAGEAILITKDYLMNYEQIMNMLNGTDMNGSGIY